MESGPGEGKIFTTTVVGRGDTGQQLPITYSTVQYSLPPPLIWLAPPLLSLLLSSLSLLPLPSLPPHLCQVPPTAPHPRSFGQSDARPAQELAVGGGEEAITPNSACFSSPPPCIPISTFILFFPYFFLASLPPRLLFLCSLILSCTFSASPNHWQPPRVKTPSEPSLSLHRVSSSITRSPSRLFNSSDQILTQVNRRNASRG